MKREEEGEQKSEDFKSAPRKPAAGEGSSRLIPATAMAEWAKRRVRILLTPYSMASRGWHMPRPAQIHTKRGP